MSLIIYCLLFNNCMCAVLITVLCSFKAAYYSFIIMDHCLISGPKLRRESVHVLIENLKTWSSCVLIENLKTWSSWRSGGEGKGKL